MTTTALVKLDKISYKAQGRTILADVSLTVHRGAIITVIGPNGAGKTTLLKIILGLLTANSGTITKASALNIGYMPQKLNFSPTMPLSVRSFLGLKKRASLDVIKSCLTEVGVPEVLDRSVHDLSGGELRRVLLARCLIGEPDLLVLDEPMQGVDVYGQVELYRLIETIRDRHNCAIILVSHDLRLVMAHTDEVICLQHHICCHGHPQQVSQDPSFLKLFGPEAQHILAVYNHEHNHKHDVSGELK